MAHAPYVPNEYQGLGGYPDAVSPTGIVREDINKNQLSDFFGAPKVPHNDYRTVAELLSSYGGSVEPPKQFIHNQLMKQSGWWTILAPPRRMERITQVSIETWYQETLELAPEDTGPKFMTHKTESFTETLLRWKIGGRFRVDFFKTTQGTAVYMQSLYQISSATYAKMKDLVIMAILNSKQYYRDRNDLTSPTDSESTAMERQNFGILSKSDQGLYKLWNSTKEIFQTENLTPSILVVPKGILSLVAFNGFESTNASVRGEGTMNRRLIMGAESLVGIFPGLDIYEDSIWANTKQQRDMLYKRITIGQFYFLDGSQIRKSCDPCETEEDFLTIEVGDARVNRMEKIGIKEGIEHGMRYDENNKLHSHHDTVIQNLQHYCELLGIKITDNMLDPYIFKVDTDQGEQWKKIEYYGDIDIRFFTIQQNLEFGQRASEQAQRAKVLTDGMREALRELMSLKELLSSPDDPLTDSFQGYWHAIEVNPENHVNPAEKPSYFLKPNFYGSEQLPYIENTDRGSRIYVVDPTGTKAYVHAIKNADRTTIGFLVGAIGEPAAPVGGGNNQNGGVAGVGLNEGETAEPVSAPSRPYGYGSITGLRTLAQLYVNADQRGWDPSLLKKAYDGIAAIDAYFGWLEKIFPLNDYFNRNFLPLHMVSGRAELDNRNAAINSLFGEQKYPVHIRISKVFNTLPRASPAQAGDPEVDVIRFTSDKAKNILKHMGFDLAGAHNKADSAKKGRTYLDHAAAAKEETLLLKILTDPSLDPTIKSLLLENEGVGLFENYKDPKYNLGTAYGGYIGKTVKASGDFSSFSHLWIKNISDETTENAVKVFNSVLKLAEYPEDMTLTQGYIDKAKSTTTKRKFGSSDHEEQRKSVQKTIQENAGLAANDGAFINSRLVLDRSVFTRLGEMIQNDDNTATRAHYSVIRPSDPRDSTKPLAGYVSNGRDDAARIKGIKEAFKLYNFAASKFRSRGTGVLDHQSLLKQSYHEFNVYDDEEYPNTFYRNQNGPFTTMANIPNDDESNCQPVGDASEIVSRPWVIRRLQEINRLEKDLFAKIPAQLFVLSKVDKRTVLGWVDNNLPQPHRCFVFAQPWVKFNMATGITGIPGSETAEIGFNHEDTILQLDVMIKDWTLHFTIYMGAFVYNARNVLVLHDIAFAGYLGGYDTKFFTNPETFDPTNPDYSNSLFAFDCCANLKRKDIPLPLNLDFKTDDKNVKYPLGTKTRLSQMLQLVCGLYYTTLWKFYQLNNGRDKVNRFSFMTEKSCDAINTQMYDGSQLDYTPSKKAHKTLYVGSGHIAEILPPFLDIFNGRAVDSNEMQKRSVLVC